MIRHVVLIRFEPTITDDAIREMFDEIAALRSVVPGIVAFDSGANVSPELGMDKGFSQGFVIDFATAADRDAYLAHPVHRAAGARLVDAAVGGVDGIIVFDMEIP